MPCSRLLLLLSGLLFSAPAMVRAEPQIDIPEIIRLLDADSFWTNRPITVQFTQKVEMYAGGQRGSIVTNSSIYIGQGVLTKNGFTAMALLDRSHVTSVDETVPARKFFIRSNDYTMSYFIYPTNADSRIAQNPNKPVNLGEATIGVPACNCTEKFWSFPMTPLVLARKLEALEDATCNPTNINGESFVQVIGKSEDEKAGMWWHILLKKTSATWLPVRTEVFFQNQRLSTIEAYFKPGAAYSLDKIQLTLFRANRVIGLFSWYDIKATLGDDTGDRFSGLNIIPSGVIVTDYRFKKPAIYVMSDSGNAPEVRRKITRMDLSPVGKKKAPENLVQILTVRLCLFTLLFCPAGWVVIKRLRTR